MKNILIIGMSNFGYFLARELVKEGVNVMAADVDEEKIERIKSFVQRAVITDATDKSSLKLLGLESMDCVVVCLGQIEPSVLTILNLKEMNLPRIVAMALSLEHGRILEMVGASDVVSPRRTSLRALPRN